MMAKPNSGQGPDEYAQEILDELESAKQKTMQIYNPAASQGIGDSMAGDVSRHVKFLPLPAQKVGWTPSKPLKNIDPSGYNEMKASVPAAFSARGIDPAPAVVPEPVVPVQPTQTSPAIDPNALTPKQLAEIAPLRAEGYRMEGIGDKDVNGNWLPNTYLSPGSTPTATKITRGFDANGAIANIQAIGRPDLMTPNQIAAAKKAEEDYKAGEAQRAYDQAQHQIWLYGDNKTIPAATAQLGAARQQAIATGEAHANDTAARKEISEENNVTRKLAIETASEDRKWQREAKTASDKEKVELKREENFDRTLKALGGGVDAMGNPVVNQKLAMTKLFSQGYKEENVPSAYKPLLSDVEKSFNNYVSTVEGNPKNAGKKLNRQTLLEKYTLLMEGRK
jgi:hypothetical protein